MTGNPVFQPRWGPVLRDLITDPQARHYHRMKNAVWLYLFFITSVGPKTGRISTEPGQIAEEMGLPIEIIQTWLGCLRKHGYIRVTKNKGQTVFQVNQWRKAKFIFDNSNSLSFMNEKPKENSHTREAKKSPQNTLFHNRAVQIAEELEDEDNIPAFEKIVQKYPENLITKALTQVKSLPDEKVRSRGALFTYLLKKYAQEKKSADSGH